jgi:hypothetical protein
MSELCGYPTLRWVIVFGKPAWEALHELRLDSHRLVDLLRNDNRVVLQFPHFAQNMQQRELFACDDAAEAGILASKPHFGPYAAAAREMRRAVREAMALAA